MKKLLWIENCATSFSLWLHSLCTSHTFLSGKKKSYVEVKLLLSISHHDCYNFFNNYLFFDISKITLPLIFFFFLEEFN